MTTEELDKLRELIKKHTRERMEEIAKRKPYHQELFEKLPSMSNKQLAKAFDLWIAGELMSMELEFSRPMIEEIKKRLTANEEPE